MPMQPAKPLVFIVDDVPENIQIVFTGAGASTTIASAPRAPF